MKLSIFFIALVFFIFEEINCEIIEIKDNGCQNWTELLQDQNLTEVTKPELYRFKKNGGIYSIYLGNEPLTVWIDLPDFARFGIIAKAHGYPNGSSPNAFLQIYGRHDCQIMIAGDGIVKISHFDNRDCFTSCSRYQENFIPFTMWSENGPVEITNMISILDGALFKFYLPETQMEEFIAATPCKQTRWIKDTFPTSDYSHLKSGPNEVFKNESGISSVRLNNDGDTVVWIEVNDSAPEHYVVIQMEDESQIFEEEDVQIGLEANGVEPISYDPEQNSTVIPNGIKIYLKKVFCVYNNNFLGHIRYIINANSTSNFTATVRVNLELKYLEEEKDGIPKPYSSPYKFEFFTIVPEPPTTTTSSTSTSTTTSASTTTTLSPTVYVPNEKEETSAAPILPATNASTKEESEEAGMSMGILIGIIVGGLIGLLLLICLMVICGLRFYRSKKRKEQQNANPENDAQGEEAVENPSFWQRIIIFLIGPAPKSSNKQQKLAPAPPPPSNVQPESSQQPSTANLRVPIMIPKSKSLKAPKTKGSKKSNVSKQAVPAPTPATTPAPTPGSTPAQTPATELPLQATQSVHSSCSDIFNETLRAAKHAKRDPRFKDLIPGTIEFMVAKGFADARTDTDDDYTRSGPRDGPEVAQFVNPH